MLFLLQAWCIYLQLCYNYKAEKELKQRSNLSQDIIVAIWSLMMITRVRWLLKGNNSHAKIKSKQCTIQYWRAELWNRPSLHPLWQMWRQQVFISADRIGGKERQIKRQEMLSHMYWLPWRRKEGDSLCQVESKPTAKEDKEESIKNAAAAKRAKKNWCHYACGSWL